MKLTYENKKNIARIVLIPLLCIFLMTLNFKIWGETYSKNDLKKTITYQMNESEHSSLSNYDSFENINITIQTNNSYYSGFTGIIVVGIVLSFICCKWLSRGKFLYKRKNTLVSLCVRMDE